MNRKCVICGGSRRIMLPVKVRPVYERIEDVTQVDMDVRYREYPCPECQIVTDGSFKIAQVRVSMPSYMLSGDEGNEANEMARIKVSEDLADFISRSDIVDFRIEPMDGGLVITGKIGVMNPRRIDGELSERAKEANDALKGFAHRLKLRVMNAGYGMPSKPYESLKKEQVIAMIEAVENGG